MDDDDGADERYIELETLEAIFPEIQKHTPAPAPAPATPTNLEFSLELPVHPANPGSRTPPAQGRKQ
ncbi:hypothetical protein BN1723_006950 [Verticillium longisporum]|uniref:RWD domain-containing protein n=1 Tax=Verticillium longisporum TaxID=100787 RepID=A0A0G4NID0_VERLO|nr:hypothetical protein BN1723_006950 [Verticillium longisporum]